MFLGPPYSILYAVQETEFLIVNIHRDGQLPLYCHILFYSTHIAYIYIYLVSIKYFSSTQSHLYKFIPNKFIMGCFNTKEKKPKEDVSPAPEKNPEGRLMDSFS